MCEMIVIQLSSWMYIMPCNSFTDLTDKWLLIVLILPDTFGNEICASYRENISECSIQILDRLEWISFALNIYDNLQYNITCLYMLNGLKPIDFQRCHKMVAWWPYWNFGLMEDIHHGQRAIRPKQCSRGSPQITLCLTTIKLKTFS